MIGTFYEKFYGKYITILYTYFLISGKIENKENTSLSKKKKKKVMYLAKDSYRTGEIENTSNLETGTSYVNRESATGFAGWLGNEQVEKRAVGGGRESC